VWPPSAWPPSLPSSRELAHEVGLHWYHENEVGTGYETDHTLWTRLQEFKDLLSDELASWPLTWSVSEVGFMAESDPDGRKLANRQAPAAKAGLPPAGAWGFQAGELVRRLLLVRAAGAARMGWHTRMAHVVRASSSMGWNEFSAHGLRNDLQYHAAFRRDLDAWRRPSWYSYRRLVWLLSQVASCEVLACEPTGLVVVRLTARGTFSIPEDGGYTTPTRGTQTIDGTMVLGPRYRYAYVAWIEQGRAATDIWLVDQEDKGFQQVSLVPQVHGADSRTGVVDDLGYPANDFPDWSWAGWDGRQCTVGEVAVPGGATWLRVHLEPLNHERLRCSPACVFTDAEYSPYAPYSPAPWQGYGESPSAASETGVEGAREAGQAERHPQGNTDSPGPGVEERG
jgi:hypothetical protein